MGRPESGFDRASEGAGTGAAVGTVGGAVIGAAACGPFWGLCAPAFAMYGAIAGTVAGSMYGFTGLSETDSSYVNEVMSRLDQERDFQKELSSQLDTRIPQEMKATPDSADVQVIVQLNRIEFIQRSEEHIQTQAVATLTFGSARRQASTMYGQEFRATSPARDIDELLADDGIGFADAIDDCVAQLSSEMGAALTQLRSAPENPGGER
ncbi:MAG: glycine zipper family protein [Gammaproteobacteria bacterium]|nr:glycine zipper family protein [Gammaproteobacteria bacterium]